MDDIDIKKQLDAHEAHCDRRHEEIRENFKSVNKEIVSTREALNEKISSVKEVLNERIISVRDDLNGKIASVRADFNKDIGTLKGLIMGLYVLIAGIGGILLWIANKLPL